MSLSVTLSQASRIVWFRATTVIAIDHPFWHYSLTTVVAIYEPETTPIEGVEWILGKQ
jgi:hypothetical protein